MRKYRVVVTDDRYGSYQEENDVLSELGIEVEVHDFKDRTEAKSVLKDADGVLVNLFPMTREIILSMNNCKVISRYGVGYDNVDVEAATEKKIWVSRVPDYSMEDTSDHAFALLLNSIRKITYRDRMVRKGKWNLHKDWPSFRIKGKTLGLIGFGNISRTLFRKVSGFKLGKILIFDPYIHPNEIIRVGGIPVSIETLLKESDYISIHVPLTEETKGMFGVNEFKLMKKTAVIINTSRGPILDEEALYHALKQGEIAAAGIDVYKTEPLPMKSPLRSLDNVTFTDHAGWYSEESIIELKTKTARNILEVLKGKQPLYPVNNINES